MLSTCSIMFKLFGFEGHYFDLFVNCRYEIEQGKWGINIPLDQIDLHEFLSEILRFLDITFEQLFKNINNILEFGH